MPPKDRKTWDCHALEGQYLGPTMDHYKCHRIYIPATRGERTPDTVEFHPTYCKMPYASSIEEAKMVIKELIAAIQKAQPPSPYSLRNEEVTRIKKLSNIFKKKLNNNSTPPRVVKGKNNAQQRVPKNHPTTHSYEHTRTPTHRYPTRNKLVKNLETMKEEPNQQALYKIKQNVYQFKKNRMKKNHIYNNQQNTKSVNDIINEIKNEASLAVMCEENGKLLNYRKLLKKNIKIHG